MELDTNSYLTLVNQLRSGVFVNEVNDRIVEFLHFPQSINILFNILSNPEIDNFSYQFTIISISRYCQFNSENIEENLLKIIRSGLLQILLSGRARLFLPTVLGAISTLISLFPTEWPEIQQMAFSNIYETNIQLQTELLLTLLPHYSREFVIERMDFLMHFVNILFQSEDLNIQCLASPLVSQISNKIQSEEFVNQVRPFFGTIFQKIIFQSGFNLDLLNRFINTIYDNTVLELSLIDPVTIIGTVSKIFLQRGIPTPFLFQLNSSFIYCLKFPQFNVSHSDLGKIMMLQFNFSLLLYREVSDDSWVTDIDSILDFIYLRTPRFQLFKSIQNNFMTYFQHEREEVRFFQLILVNELACIGLSNSEIFFYDIFPYLLQFLDDPSVRVRQYSASTISIVLPYVKSYAIDNYSPLFQKFNSYLSEMRDSSGTSMLESLVKCMSNTDEYIEYEFNVLKEFIFSPDVRLSVHSLEILHELIKCSRAKFVLISNETFGILVNFIEQDPLHYSFVLDIMVELLLRDANLPQECLNKFIEIIKNGFGSGDNNLISQSLSSIGLLLDALSIKNEFDTAMPIVKEFFPYVQSITSIPSDDEDNITSGLKGNSIFTLAFLLVASRFNSNIFSFYLECLNNCIESSNYLLNACIIRSIYYALVCLKKMVSDPYILNIGKEIREVDDSIASNVNFHRISNRLIMKIVESNPLNDDLDSTFFSFISEAISYFKLENLRIEPTPIANYLMNKLNYYISYNFIGNSKKMINNIGQAIVSLLNSIQSEKFKNDTIGIFMPYLLKLLSNVSNYQNQIIAIKILSLMLSSHEICALFTNDLYSDIINKINSFISNGNYNLCSNACKFLMNTAPCAPNTERIIPFIDVLSQSILNRFAEIQDQQYKSVSLRETLLATICCFQLNIKNCVDDNQFLNALFSIVPIFNKLKYCNLIYRYLNSMHFIISNFPEMMSKLFEVYVKVLSNSNDEAKYLNRYFSYFMAYFVNQYNDFPSQEDKKNAIIRILNNDPVDVNSFFTNFPKYLIEYDKLSNPNLSMIPYDCIDLTGKELD